MKAKLIALILGLFVISSFFVVYAQSEDETEEETLSACELIQKEMSKKIRGFEASKPGHSLTYQMLYLGSAAVAQKADVLGYNTEDVYEDLDQLELLIDQFDSSYDNFIESFIVTKDSACDSEEAYVKNLITTKNALGEVRDSIREIAEFYEDDLRKDILALEKIENE